MNRRAFALGTVALAMSPSLLRAAGAPGRAFVAHPQLVQQQCPEWCWAASASMIFASGGHPTDQKKIVAGVNNGLACGRQQPGIITQVLNGSWTDDYGQQFYPQVEAGYDQLNGIVNINNTFIINELTQNRPLLYANTHHCMVIVEADYFETPMGPNITDVLVLDPWPYNPSLHPLTPPELLPLFQGGQMMYLAAVRV
jgi:hypothetical protein